MNKLEKFSWITTSVVLVAGFSLLHFGLLDYGCAFFVAFPLALGFSMGTLNKKDRMLSSIGLSLILFFGVLLTIGWEGLFCVLMALPIFAITMVLGYAVNRKWSKHFPKQPRRLQLTIYPLIILIVFNFLEQIITPEPRVIEIKTSEILPYDAESVFHAVKQMDKLDAEKPIALMVGLPTPYRCILAADSVGARRVCLFKNGEIIAEITQYEPGKILEMDVVSYSLTGRDWFQFQDARYTFEKIKESTRITRFSSYKSTLHPRVYWEPLEKWGIRQEHLFVLRSLAKNMEEAHNNYQP